MEPLPVHAHSLSRRFGRRQALEGVDLEVGPGEIVGLVGPNGSGKTTLLKILAGFVRTDEGDVRLFGLDPFRESSRVMRRARFAFAPPALFDSLTAWEHVRHLTRLGGMRPSRFQMDEALELVGLADRREDRVGTFSFGMRQRLSIAIALLPRPSLLVLDEPTDGLDPLGILELRGILSRLREEEGVAVLLSSHLLVEIERLVDRLLVLSEGEPLFWGNPARLLEGTARLVLGTSEPARAAELLSKSGIRVLEVDSATVQLEEGALQLEDARRVLAAGGLVLESFHRSRPTLEEALFERLGKPRAQGQVKSLQEAAP